MLTIDIHTHILPKELPNWKDTFGYGGFIYLDHHRPCCAKMMRDDGKFFREIEENCWSPEVRMKECDEHHVHVQVLSTVPIMFSYWAKPNDALVLSQFLNDHIQAIVQKFPKRFLGLATVPLQDVNLAIKELERCKKNGMAGVQIGSNVNQENLGDAKFLEFFKACEELSMSVFVHPWEMMGEQHMQKYWLPWLVGMPAETSRAICSMIFSGLFEKTPKLRVAFAHGGGSFPATLGRIQHGFECRPDLVAVDNRIAPKEYAGKFWLDSLVHDKDMLLQLIKMFGTEKIALGSDYPFPLGENNPGALINSLDLDGSGKAELLSGAALKWLNRKNFLS